MRGGTPELERGCTASSPTPLFLRIFSVCSFLHICFFTNHTFQTYLLERCQYFNRSLLVTSFLFRPITVTSSDFCILSRMSWYLNITSSEYHILERKKMWDRWRLGGVDGSSMIRTDKNKGLMYWRVEPPPPIRELALQPVFV
jgi:hypothetical protein